VTSPAARPRHDPLVLADVVRRGDPAAVARLLTLVEAGETAARPVLASLATDAGRAYTIGVTGAPGAGKSSLVDRLVGTIRASGDSVAVLAVDPSSPRTGGAILGDRVRMGAHATDRGVFIRSMATRGHLGGLAGAAPQAIRVLEASGTPWVMVETVGVGQVELDIAVATDTTVVVLNPGWGDGVQANKAGLLEVADVFVVNKADRDGVDATVRDLVTMLDFARDPSWTPPIVTTVATTGTGVDDVWDAIAAHREHLCATGLLERRRRARLGDEIRERVKARLVGLAETHCRGPRFDAIVDQHVAAAVDPQLLADQLVDEIRRVPSP
jgi:LAO/AO transport system kinase